MQALWSELYGDFHTNGISLRRVRWHAHASWVDALESGAVHLFLNLQGSSLVFGELARIPLVAKTLGICYIGDKRKMMTHFSGEHELYELIVLCVTPDWINKHFGSKKHAMHGGLLEFLDSSLQKSSSLNKVRSMSYLEYELCSSLLEPPVHKEARSFWYLAKVLELLSIHLFKSPNFKESEPFCSSQKRVAKRRVDQVLIWLEEHLDQPLKLRELAKHLQCSSSYLSRLFSDHTGKTISKKLREMRIEKAELLLRDGRFNVTEVAFEVGYNSLSHFSKVFLEEKGMKPSELLHGLHEED